MAVVMEELSETNHEEHTVSRSLLDAALEYARRGWNVFPLEPQHKKPLGTLVPNGFKDATTEEALIRTWWTAEPNAGIGVATGAASGIVVLDVDPRSGGDESLRVLLEKHGELPKTLQARTGGGGQHFIFRCPDSGLKGVPNLRQGVDLKADGGYVVAAPSVHPDGPAYTWEPDQSPGDVDPAPLPDWIAEMAAQQNAAPSDGQRRLLSDVEIRALAEIVKPYWKEHQRHELALALSGYCFHQGTGQGDAKALIEGLTPDGEELEDRLGAVRSTWRIAREGKPVKGRTKLLEILGQETADRIAEIVKQAVSGGPGAESTSDEEPLLARARTLKDLRENPLPIPAPLVPDLLWPKTITMCFGPTGVGKTSFLVQLGLRLAGGVPWGTRRINDLAMGSEPLRPSRALRVLYVGAEDSPEMFEAARLNRDVLESVAAPSDLLDTNFVYLNRRLTLAAANAAETDLDRFLSEIAEQEAPFDVIVFDPLTRFYDGLDENDNGDMTRIMKAFDTIRDKTGAALLFSHHTGKIASRSLRGDRSRRSDPTQARGASVLSDQSHVVVSLSKGQGQTLVLTWAKSNYAPLRTPIVWEQAESGLLQPLQTDAAVLGVSTVLSRLATDAEAVTRARLVEEVTIGRRVTDRTARRYVGQAEEMRLVIRVNEEGEPDDHGNYVTLPE